MKKNPFATSGINDPSVLRQLAPAKRREHVPHELCNVGRRKKLAEPTAALQVVSRRRWILASARSQEFARTSSGSTWRPFFLDQVLLAHISFRVMTRGPARPLQ